jgi:hypothetical protein
MVWLKMTGRNGNGFYLDVQSVEQRKVRGEPIYVLSGTFGDGMFESTVLVEVGSAVDILFIDEWLAVKESPPFFCGTDREEIERTLRDAANSMTFCIENFPSLEGNPRNEVVGLRMEGSTVVLPAWKKARQLELPMAVCEDGGDWKEAG